MTGAKQLARRIVPRAVRNCLRAPARSARWVGYELLYLLGGRPEVEIRPGWRLRCHPGAYSFGYNNQLEDQDQVAEFDTFIAHCHPGMVFYDLGAHFGIFSLAALTFGGPDAQCVAVDPSRLAARVIRIQAKLNGVTNRIRLVESVVGDTCGEQGFVSTGLVSGGYFVPPIDHPRSEQTLMRSITLDELVSRTGLRPTVVKIDVEGWEGHVLRGGERTIKDGSPVLFLELHNDMIRQRGADPAEVIDRISSWGYTARDMRGEARSRHDLLQEPLVRVVAKPE
jgi:FkbM family methyltransferase